MSSVKQAELLDAVPNFTNDANSFVATTECDTEEVQPHRGDDGFVNRRLLPIGRITIECEFSEKALPWEDQDWLRTVKFLELDWMRSVCVKKGYRGAFAILTRMMLSLLDRQENRNHVHHRNTPSPPH